MPFRFALAPVLLVRELALEQEEQQLARLTAELARLHGTRTSLETELRELNRVRETAFRTHALAAMHLHASYASGHALRAQIMVVERQIAHTEALRIEQVGRCEAAYRQREILAGLRDRQRNAWAAAESKREERAAHEAFLARRFHGGARP